MDETGLMLMSLVGVSALAACTLTLTGKTSFRGTLTSGTGKSLPLPSGGKGSAPWYLDWTNFDSTTFEGGSMTVTYKAGAIGGGSGAAFRARPFKQFPVDSKTIGCSVYVPQDFEFTKGGKLGPGLCIGSKVGVCATGGDYSENSGSARISFSANGEAVAYLYVPEQVDKSHGRTGDHAIVSPKLRKGAWNDIAIRVNLGNPGGSGSVELTVNGVKRSIAVKWRTTAAVKISGILFATFFGGSDSSYAPKKTQKLSYKNFWVA